MLPGTPGTVLEFMEMFSTEEKCEHYLFNLRWPDGFRCAHCGGTKPWRKGARRIECATCHRETSLTAGTVLHKTRTPLRIWFWAVFLLSRSKQGISACELARQAGIRQEDAWLLLHKLRQSLSLARPLDGPVENDEALVGGVELGRSCGRSHKQKALVALAVEVRVTSTGKACAGRARIGVVEDASKQALTSFAEQAVVKAPGAVVRTDGLASYKGLSKAGFDHQPTVERSPHDGSKVFPHVHRVISNLKAWLQGTFRSVSRRYLPLYLNEFTYRFDRRYNEPSIFRRLLQRAITFPTITLGTLQVRYGS